MERDQVNFVGRIIMPDPAEFIPYKAMPAELLEQLALKGCLKAFIGWLDLAPGKFPETPQKAACRPLLDQKF